MGNRNLEASAEESGERRMESTKMVIKDSLKGFRNNLISVTLLILLISLPIAVLQTCLVDARFEASGVMAVLEEAMAELEAGETIDAGLTDASSKMLVYVALTTLLSSFSLVVHIGVMLLIRNHRNGVVAEFRDVFESALRLFPKVWLTQLLAGVFILFGLMLCFLPGIFMYFIYYMVPYSVVYTQLWGRKGLFVSSLYSRKYGKRIVGMILFGMLFSTASGFVTGFLSGLFSGVTIPGYVMGILAYCLGDLLSCLLIAVYSGFALAMPLDVDFSQFAKKK